MSTLYEIVDELLALEADLADAGGVLTPEAEAALERLEGTLEEKCERVYAYALEQEALAAQRKQEAARLADLAKTNENRAAALSGWLLEQLRRLPPGKSVQTRLGRLAPQRNSTPNVWPVLPLDMLDEGYRRITVEPNRAAALELWRATVRQVVGEAKGAERQRLLSRAYAEATQALADAGFRAEMGWHLRTFS